MGSGSTGVACINTNRDFIGYELDKNYFNIAKQRIESAYENSNKRNPLDSVSE
jgi:site-specific DNA-methyltransferase (adenine-specific)